MSAFFPNAKLEPGTYHVGEGGELVHFVPAKPVVLNGKRFVVGSKIEAKYRGAWYPATVESVTQVQGETALVIKWDSPHEKWGTAVWHPHAPQDVRLPAGDPGVLAGKAFKENDVVEALYRGEWSDGIVTQVGATSLTVKWSPPNDKWGSCVWDPHSATDIRLRGGAPTPRRQSLADCVLPGAEIEARYGPRGEWYNATVLSVTSELVTLQWDEPHSKWGTAAFHPHAPADVRHKALA